MKEVIILGISRSYGDAKFLADRLVKKTNWDLIVLNDYKISYYDYENSNKKDDYINLMKSIIKKYDTLVFMPPFIGIQ